MKTIDFLPDIYRQRRQHSRARRWWCLVAGLFAAAILLAASAQWMMRRGIQLELAQVEPKYAEALKREVELATVRQEIVRADEIASLYAYLAHPWPRTQLLAGIIRPLPDSIRLTEVTIAFETLPQSPVINLSSSLARLGESDKAAPSPAMQDLTLLKNECDGRQAILSISGTATVITELHAYVDQLGKSPLFAAAHLKGVESAGSGKLSGEAYFHIHVVVRPGYGQQGGPPLEPEAPSPNQISVSDSRQQVAQGGAAP